MSDDMFYARVCEERDALRAELAAAKEERTALAAHDAATKEPSPFLSRAAWRVVKEIWIDVAAGRMNARSAVADAALDLRGLLEESGPEPADDVVGVKRKADRIAKEAAPEVYDAWREAANGKA